MPSSGMTKVTRCNANRSLRRRLQKYFKDVIVCDLFIIHNQDNLATPQDYRTIMVNLPMAIDTHHFAGIAALDDKSTPTMFQAAFKQAKSIPGEITRQECVQSRKRKFAEADKLLDDPDNGLQQCKECTKFAVRIFKGRAAASNSGKSEKYNYICTSCSACQ